MPPKAKSGPQTSKSKFRLRISIKARGLGDILVARPCFFGVQVILGTDLEAYAEWLPAPIYRAPRHELDFGVIAITIEEEILTKIRHTRAPLKLSLLTASKPSSSAPIVAGFVLVDSRFLNSSVGQGLTKQWHRLQSAKCKGTSPELNIGCKLQWASRDSDVPSEPVNQIPVTAAHMEDSAYADEQFEPINDDEIAESEEPSSDPVDLTESTSEPKKEIQMTTEERSDLNESDMNQRPAVKALTPDLAVTGLSSNPAVMNSLIKDHTQPQNVFSQASYCQSTMPSNCQYRISVDLCAIRDLSKPGSFYARYLYPLFETQIPIATHPPVHVEVNTEVSLPNSFCAFEFALTQEKLESTLSRDPLIVEIVLKDDDQIESIIGVATLNLTELLTAPSSVIDETQIRAIDRWVPVFSHVNEDSANVVLSGSLRCALFLEEFDTKANDSNSIADASNCGKSGAIAEFARGSEAYHVAWELESWKRKQQEAFKAYLTRMEEKRKQQIEAKLQELIEEKTMYFLQKEKTIVQMEKKLQQTLYDVRNQEKTLRQQEEEHAKLKDSLIRDHDLKIKEDAAFIKSLKRQHEQEVGLLSREKANLLERLNEMERLCNEQTELLLGIKRKFAASVTGKLQEELAEVKFRLQAADEQLSKQKTKEKRMQSQLVACLNELARLRQATEIIENERLDQERLELQRLRVQLMAKEREKELGSDRMQLRSIRDEIRKMLSKPREDVMVATPMTVKSSREESATTKYVSAEHERLCRERSELIQTGIYTEDHDLIKTIDLRIEQIKREHL